MLVTAAGEQIADMLCRGDLLRGYLSLCIREKRVKRGDHPLGLITDMATAHYGCVGWPFMCGCAGRCCSSHPVNSCCPSVLQLTAVGLADATEHKCAADAVCCCAIHMQPRPAQLHTPHRVTCTCSHSVWLLRLHSRK